jgi:hypothetical protein
MVVAKVSLCRNYPAHIVNSMVQKGYQRVSLCGDTLRRTSWEFRIDALPEALDFGLMI